MKELSQRVVLEDQRLEAEAKSASEELARHRWHWTLDESNPGRVSFRAYARAVGKSDMTIRQYANGYELHTARNIPLTEAMQRAVVGAETEAATEAVAKARGKAFGTAKKSDRQEVKRVRQIARDRAEERGTSIEEEAPKVAETIVKSEQAEQKRQDDRKNRLGLRFVEMEKHLDAVKRRLIQAVNLAHDVEWGDEERELLADTLGNVRSLLNLIDVAMAGAADIDWDDELARLTEEVDQ